MQPAIDRTDEHEVCVIYPRNRQGRAFRRPRLSRLILAGGEVGTNARSGLTCIVGIALDIDRYDFRIRVDIDGGRPDGRMEKVRPIRIAVDLSVHPGDIMTLHVPHHIQSLAALLGGC